MTIRDNYPPDYEYGHDPYIDDIRRVYGELDAICPHCGSLAIEAPMEPHPSGMAGEIQVGPTICSNCGASEFHPFHDIVFDTLTDEEVWAGWHMGVEGQTRIKLTADQRQFIENMRNKVRLDLEQKAAEQRAQEEKVDYQRRLIDEAIF